MGEKENSLLSKEESFFVDQLCHFTNLYEYRFLPLLQGELRAALKNQAKLQNPLMFLRQKMLTHNVAHSHK
jgi:hypothetical protein